MVCAWIVSSRWMKLWLLWFQLLFLLAKYLRWHHLEDKGSCRSRMRNNKTLVTVWKPFNNNNNTLFLSCTSQQHDLYGFNNICRCHICTVMLSSTWYFTFQLHDCDILFRTVLRHCCPSSFLHEQGNHFMYRNN